MSWWRYPANTHPGLNPWYVMAWRGFWLLPFMVGYAVAAFAELMAYGGRR